MPSINIKMHILAAIVVSAFILIIPSVSFIISYGIIAVDREHEYEVIRQNYTQLIEKHRREYEIELNRLREQMNSQMFINQKRYELLQEELSMLKHNNKN